MTTTRRCYVAHQIKISYPIRVKYITPPRTSDERFIYICKLSSSVFYNVSYTFVLLFHSIFLLCIEFPRKKKKKHPTYM